ncbi:MAG: 2-amino-4-hydroxy-6-hydroxymethyldihydropteridine diphosphokinase [Endomicrobium sp.]|jgi:2-amino-4-hydroxy-6-hydroxymethyldihydropteridine diphosphokinase|nr:2-amino-4-hydroxy-6-hydroxymethyldihydropteridine diphosphokinase [Endomicrobium sp.]
MEKIYLSMGSNIGDRAENIISALSLLQSSAVHINRVSSFYETSPVGAKQRNFYNIALQAKTALSPRDLLAFVKQSERILGRKFSKRFGPRVIDIDILFYGGKIVKIEKKLSAGSNKSAVNLAACRPPVLFLEIPHREIQNRLFVLKPLCEIAPNLIHPVLNGKIKLILKNNLTLKNQKVKIVKNI